LCKNHYCVNISKCVGSITKNRGKDISKISKWVGSNHQEQRKRYIQNFQMGRFKNRGEDIGIQTIRMCRFKSPRTEEKIYLKYPNGSVQEHRRRYWNPKYPNVSVQITKNRGEDISKISKGKDIYPKYQARFLPAYQIVKSPAPTHCLCHLLGYL